MIQIIHGDCLEAMRGMTDASIDSVVTDPPYGLQFMGRAWDHGVPGVPFWFEMLRLLKPGGHLVAFGGTRTYHRMACAIEDAGFEIRDQLGWLFGSGFPKSQNVGKAFDKAAGAERELTRPGVVTRSGYGEDWDSADSSTRPRYDDPVTALAKQWDGWGTALKPAWEPICLARKPLIGTVAANVTAHGTGAINIRACRVGTASTLRPTGKRLNGGAYGSDRSDREATEAIGGSEAGRWPANLCHDGSDEVLEAFARFGSSGSNARGRKGGNGFAGYGGAAGIVNDAQIADTGTAARFFYTAKADREEREIGHIAGERNGHPTVKPVDLMQWLCRLVTPPGGTVLDPFAGSGSTGIAADREGFNAILIEREAEYVTIARRRIDGDAPLFAQF